MSSAAAPIPATGRSGAALAGTVGVPGDKSISHRSLMLGGLAVGETVVTGLLEGEDVLRTAAAMRAMGAEISKDEATGVWRARGRGVGALAEPADVLDLGNAGTGARLLMGLVATHPMVAVFTGDASLRRRPMGRVTVPLEKFGARFVARGRAEGKVLLPLTAIGSADPLPIEYAVPVPSAQVKSAVLLAGLNAPGTTVVVEKEATRDHTELMFRHFGAEIDVTETPAGTRIALKGRPELTGRAVDVPGDPSSAAFPLVAGLIVPSSEVTVRNVGLNPRRTGLYQTLREMGAVLDIGGARTQAGEPVGDISVRFTKLKGVDVPAHRAPSMIDEYPILAVAAACAKGRTVMRGLNELRVKESDRLSAIARGLAACGVSATIDGDDLIVEGHDGPPPGMAAGTPAIKTHLDHRIAMSFLVMGLASAKPVTVDDIGAIATSFPGFIGLVRGLGGTIDEGR
jgi:3-phosphoshikimate 1-carboxyvinyltransferase